MTVYNQVSGFFDSTKIIDTVEGFPRGDKAVDAEFLADFVATFFSDGVAKNYKDGFAGLTKKLYADLGEEIKLLMAERGK